MKRIGMIVILIAAMAGMAFAQAGPRDLTGPENVQQQKQAQAPLQQSIIALYLSDFRREVELTEDQFINVVPIVRNFIQQRFRIANERQSLDDRKSKLLSQPNPSPTELQELNNLLTKQGSASGSWKTRFMLQLQPHLTDLQRVRAYDFDDRFMSEKLPALVEKFRADNAAARGAQSKPAMRANPNRGETLKPGSPVDTLRGNDVPVVPRRKLTR